jgi:hypothetical protein
MFLFKDFLCGMSFSGKFSCQNHAGEDVIARADTNKKSLTDGLMKLSVPFVVIDTEKQ